ncbi:MAG: hypothetical protein KJ044_11055, partial [Planctomycetes bacterium]|nr:hypothetical protein [Planctomycetota bacterium]
MRLVHVTIGALLVCALAAGVVAGLYLLRETDSGGLRVAVRFAENPGLAPDHDVLYGDKVVGRVESARDNEVGARIAADYADLVREGSRFWVQNTLAARFLVFDSPPSAGPPAVQGARFEGLARPPEPPPGALPAPTPRKLASRPAWLCDARAVLTLPDGADTVRDQARHSAAAVAHAESGTLLVLAPAWLFENAGAALSARARVELAGGEVASARLVATQGALCVLAVEGSAWRGTVAPLWPHELADGQGLVLADFDGLSWAARHGNGGLEFRAALTGGRVAFVDGLNLAGFALPAVGERTGARWVSLHGALTLLQTA